MQESKIVSIILQMMMLITFLVRIIRIHRIHFAYLDNQNICIIIMFSVHP